MSRVNWLAVLGGCALALILALAGFYAACPGGTIVIPEAPAEISVPASIVAVTPNGEKYHRETCSALKNSSELKLLSPEDAASQGYEPCQRCKP